MPKEAILEADSAEQAVFKKKLKELTGYKGRGTELISVYIPFGTDRGAVMNQLSTEMGQSGNIKSPQTRKNVQSALKKISNYLKQINFNLPPTGLVVFAGNISPMEGRTDLRLFVVKPLKQLRTKLYWCDSSFHLEPLQEMTAPTEIYAFIVMDKREATIALLVGKRYEIIGHFTSNVAGKTRAGGQCLVPDTQIMLDDGRIIPIKHIEIDQHVKTTLLEEYTLSHAKVIDTWDVEKNATTIVTKYPRIEITSSPEHVFFTFNREKDTIEEKSASELDLNDILLMPETIPINGSIQKLQTNLDNKYQLTKEGINYLRSLRQKQGLSQKGLGQKLAMHQATVSAVERGWFKPRLDFIIRYCNGLGIDYSDFISNYMRSTSNIDLSNELTPEIAQLAGYFLGDGNYEKERLSFSEQRKEVAEYYTKKYATLFKVPINLRYRENKNYYQIRIPGKSIVRYFRTNFYPIKNTMETTIPQNVLQSPNETVAAFLKGLFDAEGYISNRGMGLGIINRHLAQQIQLVLLRFSIIASFHEYDSARNPYSKNHRFTVDITEKESLEYFAAKINFTATDKKKKLEKWINGLKGRSSVRQILIGGSTVRSLFEKEGLNTQDFPSVTNFFRNERNMSKKVFSRQIISRVAENPLLKTKFEAILNRPLIPVGIASIKSTQNQTNMTDISIENPNFFANGLLVHNSSARFEHLREEAANDFYKSVTNKINSSLEGKWDKIRGVIVGGPGQTKNEFLDVGELDYRLKEKILGILDLSYTDESGIREIIQRSEELLRNTALMQERKAIDTFLTQVVKDGLATYGAQDVEDALEKGQVNLLILSEGITWRIIKVKCVNCEEEQVFRIKDEKQEFDEDAAKCSKCSSHVEVVEEVDYLDYLLEKAHAMGTKTMVISMDTPEGQQFYASFGGVGAMLRYK